MAENATRNSGAFAVSTPSEQEIRMTRRCDAPRELVFEAMSKPEHVKQWWGRLGEGYSVPVCEIDVRLGGSWRFVNRHPSGEAAFYGESREIQPPGRVVFTEIFEEDGKTRLTATVRYPSKDVRDAVMASGMSHGAGISYDRLEDLVATLRRPE